MKNIKRTLSLMIVAGLLTAGLASCVVKGDGEGSGEVPSGTEPQYSITTNPNNDPPTPVVNDPTKVEYTEENDFVYVVKTSAAIKLASDITQTKNLSQFTELNRIGTSSKWYKVKYEDQEYYVAADLVTTDDIGEKTFTACDPVKTMYTSGSVNLRKYASSNNDFSTVLKTLPNGTEVKVVKQSDSKGWSRVECTVEGTEYKGFMSTQHLTSNPSGEADDFLKNFTKLDQAVTMYVSTEKANLRAKPYADNRGTIIDVILQGMDVKVIAKGIVENHSWCMIERTENSVKKSYYVSSDCLSVTASGTSATLEQMLSAYPELEKFETEQKLYILASIENATVRSTPTRVVIDNKSNAVDYLGAKDEVTAVAVGKIKGQNPNGEEEEMTWCLIKHETKGFCFIAYSNLTRNSDGTPATPVISLEKLVEMYGFTKTQSAVAKKTNAEALLYSEPSDSASSVKVSAGTAVTAYAQGTTTDGFVSNSWYIVQYEGSYYFVIQSLLQDA